MEYIRKLTKLPTSDEYILNKIKTNIVTYSELKNVNNIDDVFINDSCIILYEKTAGDVGHWCCMVKRNNLISYFDSYGREPDPYIYLRGQYPYLSKLLYKSPYNLEYNEYDYQSKNVSTCGHHCIVRILFKYKPLKKYQDFMNQFKNDDDVVTAISTMI